MHLDPGYGSPSEVYRGISRVNCTHVWTQPRIPFVIKTLLAFLLLYQQGSLKSLLDLGRASKRPNHRAQLSREMMRAKTGGAIFTQGSHRGTILLSENQRS
jgi:hypothetical protein